MKKKSSILFIRYCSFMRSLFLRHFISTFKGILFCLSLFFSLVLVGSGLIKSSGTLVVCPASLVHQWDREIERRCNKGLLKVCLYHGPNREKDIRKWVALHIKPIVMESTLWPIEIYTFKQYFVSHTNMLPIEAGLAPNYFFF